MASSRIGGGVFTMLLVVLVLGIGRWVVAQAPEGIEQVAEEAPETHPGGQGIAAEGSDLLYGRVTTDDGTIHEGRLRFGGDEEALWSNYFNGYKAVNPWVALVPDELRPTDRRALTLFGLELAGREVPRDLGRPFMARFGDVARIDARGRDLHVTLKSGTVFRLDRFGADDFADGLMLWDEEGRVLELGEWGIRSIEFLPASASSGIRPTPLYGTVRTAQGDFTGLIQWDREETLVTDGIGGLSFEIIESIERTSSGSRVVVRHGETLELTGSRKVGDGNRGIYVDDPRYGRVLVSWDAFDRIDFSSPDHARGYERYPPGAPLHGSVTTAAGRTLAGRIVYDLDESETTETLDAPSRGVNYMVPFGMIASIERGDDAASGADPALATVVLSNGETLRLEAAGDLADANAGLLVFVVDATAPEYVPWSEVRRIDLEVPPGT
ncbi:MAG: hypothetical protein HKN72_15835 [Gemmatimonadetes bacterium]|nr:hypothetical protein [Gemmatimonadota bacterium]NNF14698.1 hypothetical protein [Gemmatimonadota bacterium]NNL31097.1 hypothetical protein [Gemmatimonadota bacterium]